MGPADKRLFCNTQEHLLRQTALRIALVLGAANLAFAANATLHSQSMSFTVQSEDGSYEILGVNSDRPIIHARIAAEIDHKWVRYSDYPRHERSQSTFKDALGTGRQITMQATGLADLPDLSYTIQMYNDQPFGTITVQVQNRTGHIATVQDIRSVEAIGTPAIELGNAEATDRVLSDSFSEDWPPMQIKDLGQADRGMLRAVGSQLIYNLQSKESLFLGALTSEKFLTILHLEEKPDARNAPSIVSYRVDSTGTTEIQSTEPESDFRNGPRKNLIELSLPVSSGKPFRPSV